MVEEPGRRIVREELSGDGAALPWHDPVAFARRALTVSLSDLEAAKSQTGTVFFDRGLVDAAAALTHLGHTDALQGVQIGGRYGRAVFLAPPWPEIYVTDGERRHGFHQAAAEFERLTRFYPLHGYDLHVLPKASIERRVAFVLKTLAR